MNNIPLFLESDDNMNDKKLANIKPRIIIFTILILVTVISLSFGFSNLFLDKGPTWTLVELSSIKDTDNEFVFPFYDEIRFYYFATGSKDNRVKELKDIKEEFNQIISKYFMLFDTERSYVEKNGSIIKNLKYLNTHPNEDIVIDPILYNSLKSAYENTIKLNSNYNIFAGSLSSYWLELLTLGDIDLDPINNVEKQSELNQIVNTINDFGCMTFDLKFKDDNVVNLFVVDNYTNSKYIQVNLQALAYILTMEALANDLIAKDYLQGYIYSTYFGFYKMLGLNPTSYSGGFWSNKIYYPTKPNEEPISFASLNVYGAYNSIYFGDFLTPYYYQINQDIIRHPYYDSVTGYPKNLNRMVGMFSNTITLTDMFYLTNTLFNLDKAELKSVVESSTSNDDAVIIAYNDDINLIENSKIKFLLSSYLKDNDFFKINSLYKDKVIFAN